MKDLHEEALAVQMATRMAGVVRRRFQACGFADHGAADLDDVAQDAALAVVETIRSGRARADAPATYYYRAAARQAGEAASRALSVVSLSERALVHARTWQTRVQVDGCSPARSSDGEVVSLPGTCATDARLSRRDRARAALAAGVVLRRALDARLALLKADHRRALELYLGFEGEVSGMDEVCWRLRMAPQTVRAAIRRLSELIKTDARARAARVVMREDQEDT